VGERLIAGGGPSGNRSLMQSVVSHISVELNWCHEVQHIPTAIEWTGAGIGHTIVPQLMLRDRLPESVRRVEITSPRISRAVGIVYRSGERLSADADLLRRGIAAALRQVLTQGLGTLNGKSPKPIHVRLGEESIQF
jgi:DNA-binding transcriptional LysR family regulator